MDMNPQVDGVHTPAVDGWDAILPAMAPPPDADDQIPLVVLDDDADLAALAAAGLPSLTAQAQDYLRSQGVTDERTWAAFRLGTVSDADLHRLLTSTQLRQLRPSGIWLPTFDPHKPEVITGLIRLTPAQNQHRIMGTPTGLAGPADLDQRRRVVLVDNPLLALRLHERGVPGVAIVEDPAVLLPLTAWLAAREVVTITGAKKGDLLMPPGITPIGTGRICGKLEWAPAATLALLGLDVADLRQPLTPLPLDPRVVCDLHAYAEGRLQTEAGMMALAALDCDEPDVLRAYRVGFLPADVRMALTEEQRRMLLGRELGGCLVLPAFDQQGAVVDLVVQQVCAGGSVSASLWDSPRGLCAPTLCTAFDHLAITTVPRWVGRLFRSVGPTLLLRGVANAQAEAARIAAGGVTHVELRCYTAADADGVAEALRAVGIMVRVVGDEARARPTAGRRKAVPATEEAAEVAEADAVAAVTDLVEPPVPTVAQTAALVLVPVVAPPAVPVPAEPSPASTTCPPPPTLDLVSHDPQTEQAVFSYGPATYTVQVPWGTSSTVEVAMVVGSAKHRDRFDLAVAPQRLRFATAAGLRTKVSPADIAHALALILPAVRRLVEVKPAEVVATPVAGMSSAERDTAMALLRDPALVEQFTAAFDSLGWVGEPDAKLVVLLAAISRLGEEPVWTALTAETTGERFPALGILAAITPPEHLLHVSRLTDNALFHGDADALHHKLLVLDDVGGVSSAVATALHVLHAQGVLSGTQVERDVVRGKMRTKQVQARGPLAVVTATATGIPAALAQHLVELAVDDSPAQAERLIAARQRKPVDAAPLVARLMNAQRLLRSLPVQVPGDVAVPVVISRHRALHAPFFGLVAASALLHQHQRPVLDGRLVATAGDVALASRAVLPLVGQVVSGLGHRGQAALVALGRIGTSTCTVVELAKVMPDWSAMTVRRAIDDLVVAGCLVTERRRNGVQASYRLVSTPTSPGDLFSFSPPFHATCEGPIREVVNG